MNITGKGTVRDTTYPRAEASHTASERGLATYTIYIIIVSFMIFIVIIVVFSKWVEPFKTWVARGSCGFKHFEYCMDWKRYNYDSAHKPTTWADKSKPPNDCETLKPPITEPTKKEDCE